MAFLLAGSALAFLFISVPGGAVGDVPVYESGIRRLLHGERPWADFVYEYPPLSLALGLLPALAPEGAGFRYAFAIEMLLAHLGLGWLLLREGRAALPGWLALAPFGLLTASAVFLEYVYLRRFDVTTSLACVLAIVATRDEKYGRAAAWLAVGVELKLYPAVLLPVVVVPAWRARRLKAAVAGFALGSAPLIVCALLGLPFWRVLAFHSARGLQAESLGGSILWLLRHLGVVEASWTWLPKWVEITGPWATPLRDATSLAFLFAVTLSAGLSAWRLAKTPAPSLGLLARAALAPIAAALVFSSVLSPQFLVWLVGLTGLAMTEGGTPSGASGAWRVPALVLAATALVPLFFPSPQYNAGLELPRTLALVARNVLLLAAWVELVRSLARRSGAPA